MKQQLGFTLIELMIVVAIIGILAAIALPQYQNFMARSQAAESVVLLDGARTTIEEYATSNGAASLSLLSKLTILSRCLGICKYNRPLHPITITKTRGQYMANLNQYDISKTWHAVITSSQRITSEQTDEVRNLTLHIPDGGFNYQVGQSIGILFQGPHPFGNAQHLRLYSIAGDAPAPSGRGVMLDLCVRRCFYIDEVSGERYPGIASNRLCDAQPGEQITLTGPYGSHFQTPEDNTSNLLMIGTGTGIAPFRAFLQRVYKRHNEWKGQVRLYYGARTGMEVLYNNDRNTDLTLYYDQATFKAIEGLSKRPWLGEGNAIAHTLEQHAQDIWDLMQDDHTCVYLAGLEKISAALDEAMSKVAGSKNRWNWMRRDLQEQGRWSELLYS